MKQILFCFFIVILLTMVIYSNSTAREARCLKKRFVCYDETRFYECVLNGSGQYNIKGYLQNCPIGLVCNDNNEFECEEDISREFLTDEKYYFKFSGKEGRKYIIDD